MEREELHRLWMARWDYFHTTLMTAAHAFDPEFLRDKISDSE